MISQNIEEFLSNPDKFIQSAVLADWQELEKGLPTALHRAAWAGIADFKAATGYSEEMSQRDTVMDGSEEIAALYQETDERLKGVRKEYDDRIVVRHYAALGRYLEETQDEACLEAASKVYLRYLYNSSTSVDDSPEAVEQFFKALCQNPRLRKMYSQLKSTGEDYELDSTMEELSKIFKALFTKANGQKFQSIIEAAEACATPESQEDPSIQELLGDAYKRKKMTHLLQRIER